MDIFLLNRLIAEISPCLTGHRPGRVWQLGSADLLIDFNQRDGRRLRISTDPLRLGLYLTERDSRQFHLQPRTDTGFVGLWRKYLEGTRLQSIEPLGYDRIVHFNFSDDSGTQRRVVVSLTGRTANIYLLAGDELIAALRERDFPLDRYDDPAPLPDRLDPLSTPVDEIAGAILAHDKTVEAAAARHLLGFTPLLGRELAWRIDRSPGFADAWRSMVSDLTSETGSLTLYASPPLDQLRAQSGIEEAEMILSHLPLYHLPSELKTHPTNLNEGAEIYFGLLDDRRRFFALRQRLASQLNSRLKKLGVLLGNLDREEERYRGAEDWQRLGELLLINLPDAVATEKGGWLVIDHFDLEQPVVEIDAAECGTVRETAEHYFRLARKGRRSRESIASRRPGVIDEVRAIENDQRKLASITRIEELLEWAERYGLTDKSTASLAKGVSPGRESRQSTSPIPGIRRYRSGDGYEILVGRTDRDNDHLTLRIARSADLWFHAADYPGSHVVLRNPNRLTVPHRSILEAARLAAKFSQARELPKVAVNYCEKKFVTKPKGFAPGQVRLAAFRTVLVEPSEAGERL